MNKGNVEQRTPVYTVRERNGQYVAEETAAYITRKVTPAQETVLAAMDGIDEAAAWTVAQAGAIAEGIGKGIGQGLENLRAAFTPAERKTVARRA